MAKIEVDLGHNIRAWTTFTIEDATEEEAEVLGNLGSSEAVEMLRNMVEVSKRATEHDTTYEEDAPFFDAAAEADVIDARGEDD